LRHGSASQPSRLSYYWRLDSRSQILASRAGAPTSGVWSHLEFCGPKGPVARFQGKSTVSGNGYSYCRQSTGRLPQLIFKIPWLLHALPQLHT
jgi:hypothetical protein